MLKSKTIVEFGDFQTPHVLATKMVEILSRLSLKPAIIIEPTCGIGEILFNAIEHFKPDKAIGVEINAEYTRVAKNRINGHKNIAIFNEDIFSFFKGIDDQLSSHCELLFIGNPPWVTNSALGAISGSNIPHKTNYKNFNGIEAITGKSNFDIAEYILMCLIDKYSQKNAVFAFLCKTIVARNLLKWVWQKNLPYATAGIYPIDSMKYFSAAVDACFFIIDFRMKCAQHTCDIYDSIEAKNAISTYGLFEDTLIKDFKRFQSHNFFGKSDYTWRNGIKHDCSKIMEFDLVNDTLINGLGIKVDIERDLVYPLLKSSDLQKTAAIRKYVLVTQHSVGEDTHYIKKQYPKTWTYLEDNQEFFNMRMSSIYKNKPPFSIFSIGKYSFSPFKIAISGLYKSIHFVKIGQLGDKSILVDDTCNFIPCSSEQEADLLLYLLNSKEATNFFNAVIFWDSKRPVTTSLLNKLSLSKLANVLNISSQYHAFMSSNTNTNHIDSNQRSLF